MATILFAASAVAVMFALVAWIIVLQARLIVKQSETIEKLRRACDRERAGRMVVESELDHVSRSAGVVSLWRERAMRSSQ